MKEEIKGKIEEMKSKIMGGFWWLIAGVVISTIIGFGWGGWVTAGTSQKMSDEAVLASQAAICVAQFMKDSNYEAKLKELEGMDSWKRSDFIEKAGWDKMPGQKEAGPSVSRACVSGIEVLMKK